MRKKMDIFVSATQIQTPKNLKPFAAEIKVVY